MIKPNNNRLFFDVSDENDAVFDRLSNTPKTSDVFSFLFLPCAFLAIELLFRQFLFGFSLNIEEVYLLLHTLAIAMLVQFILSFMPEKTQRFLAFFAIFIYGVYSCFHLVYANTFHSFFSWNTLAMADDVTEFYREALTSILKNGVSIILIMLPSLLFLIFKKKYSLKKGLFASKIIYFLLSLVGFAGLVLTLITSKESIKLLKYTNNNLSGAYKRFGVALASSVDIYHCFAGYQDEVISNPYVDDSLREWIDVSMSEEEVILRNALPIDFNTLIENSPSGIIKEMSSYFSMVPASNKNDYTGYFEGKNLVFLTLEGFSGKIIDPQLTPTLYKMAHEGFVFTNFYDSIWGGSTATGEYSNMTGNFYPTANCLTKSSGTLTYSAMGNLFKNGGYQNFAFHNNTYTYYSRDLSHPNFGYKWKAIGNGLSLPGYWPRSDYEMAVKTVDDYILSEKPFHAYYMTVSGHTYYTWIGNSMSSRHRDEVQHLNYSENVKAYIACNLEVENMLTYLVSRFEEAGILDDTVFAMCTDHYPYGLDDPELAELYQLPENQIRSNLELYRNNFILWSSSMEQPIVVDTPCSSIDIVPTLANLFNIEYDSRLITGTDIFSDNEKICIVNTLTAAGGDYNWITPQGTYYSAKDVFEKSKTCSFNEEQLAAYVEKTKQKVDAMRKYSIAILDYDYYSYVFNKDFSIKYPLSE